MVMEIVVSVALLFVGIVVLVFIHVCVVGRALRGRNGMNGTIFIPRGMISRTQTMSQEDIKKIPCFEYKVEEEQEATKDEKNAIVSVDCAVCLENFKVGDKCRMLKCNHSFHAQCIDSWLINTAACPICRAGAKNSPSKTTSTIEEEDQEEEVESSSNNNAHVVGVELT